MDFIGLFFISIFALVVASATGSQKKAKMQQQSQKKPIMQQQSHKEVLRRYYEIINTGSNTASKTAKPPADRKPNAVKQTYVKPQEGSSTEGSPDFPSIEISPEKGHKAVETSDALKALSDLPSAIIASEILSKPKALRRFR
jgi:hypothetical protein